MTDSVTIEDNEGTRLVSMGGIRLSVPYSRSFLDALAHFRKGRDLLDELLRSEHPPYIHARLESLLKPYAITSWTVLDYGCGAGASAVCLSRLGVRHVVGVDLVNDYARIWRQRLSEAGFPHIGEFVQAGDSSQLPFREGQFDAVFLNGLVEHLLPEERSHILKEALRVTRPAGFVFVTETPNKWFPRNSHTKLWFSELLPFEPAAWLAARLGPRRDFPIRSRTAIYRTGMRGASIPQLRNALGPAAHYVESDTAVVTMEFLLPRNPLDASPGKERLGPLLLTLTKFASTLLRIPLQQLSPHVNAAFQKTRLSEGRDDTLTWGG